MRVLRASRLIALAVFMLGQPASDAHANDSTAILQSGALQLTYNPDIRLEREALYLSAEEIRVHYRFRNTSKTDITTLVAFPMPQITVGDSVDYDVNAKDPANFIGFEVNVNGQPIEPRMQMRAIRFGVDQTALLKRHGIPVFPFAADFYTRLETLDGASRAELQRAGLVDWNTSFGANNKPLPNPHWRAEMTYYWQQTFPANAVTEVRHAYRPVAGLSFYGQHVLEDRALQKTYCTDRAFLAAARRLFDRAPNGFTRELHYVLKTGANWLGAIGEFRLTIDKGEPDNLVSLCIDGISKSGPATFEFRAKDFIPERDLKILFLEPAPSQ